MSLKKLLILSLFGATCEAHMPQLIERVTVKHNRVDIQVNKKFRKKYLHDDFFIEYDNDINLNRFGYSIVTLPFLMNVVSIVWATGARYEIDEMDEGIYESLKRLKQVFKIMYPRTNWDGDLVPRKLVSNTPLGKSSDMIAVLGSGGVDSTTTSLFHRDRKQLMITAWGQGALPLHRPGLWKTIKEHLVDFAQEYGHKNAFIKSNYYYFLNFPELNKLSPDTISWRIDTIEDIGWAGLTAPILLTHGIKELYIGSSATWEFPYGCCANPYVDGVIEFAGLTFHHDLFSWYRGDKVAYITELARTQKIKTPQLIICQQKGDIINCGSCQKCFITLALLMWAEADLKEYGYSMSRSSAIRSLRHYLTNRPRLESSVIAEYQDLQRKLAKKPCKDLEFIEALDFSKIKPFDLPPGLKPVPWHVLDELFPYARARAT